MVPMREVAPAEARDVDGGWYSLGTMIGWGAVAGAVGYAGYRLLPQSYRTRVNNWAGSIWRRVTTRFYNGRLHY